MLLSIYNVAHAHAVNIHLFWDPHTHAHNLLFLWDFKKLLENSICQSPGNSPWQPQHPELRCLHLVFLLTVLVFLLLALPKYKCSWKETLTSFPSPAEDEVVCSLSSHCNAEMGGRAPEDKGAHVWLACVGIWGLVSILGEVFQFWGHSKGKGETEGRGWKKKSL